MWTIAAVNKKFTGPLGSYNGLTDVHLAHFFSQPSRQSHLKAVKLITDDGFIVPEKSVKGELHLHEKKRKNYDILARSVLQNAVHEEGSWNKKLCNYLEDISKMIAVDKARNTMKKKNNKMTSEFFFGQPLSYNVVHDKVTFRSPSKSANSSRNFIKPPNSAPSTCICFCKEGQQKFDKLKKTMKKKYNKMTSEFFFGQPFSYNVIHDKVTFRSPLKSANSSRNFIKPPNSAPSTCICFCKEGQQKFDKLKRTISAKQYSPYGMPLMLSGSCEKQIQSLFCSNRTPKQKKRKQRKLNNFIKSSNSVKDNNFSNCFTKVSAPCQALKLSQCQITMLYHGHLHITNFQKALTQNIIIKQQHCGGTPVVIYKGNISANESLSFFTLDHEGFFFSLTVFLNGIRELKLSSCCVFRYLPGKRLGGPNGAFTIRKIEGGKPCLKCQYQEYENNEFKVTSQSPGNSVDAFVNVESSQALENDIKDASDDKTLLENSKTPSPSEINGQLNDESLKVTDTESYPDDEIEEILDEGMIQDVSPEGSIEDEKSDSLHEDVIIEKQDSDSIISSVDGSEISEQYVNNEQTMYQTIDTSSSEAEGENHHIITASVH